MDPRLHEAMIDRREAELDAWDAQMKKVKARIAEAEASARVQAIQALNSAREARDEAAAKLVEMREKGSEAAEELTAGFERAWHEASAAMQRARQAMN